MRRNIFCATTTLCFICFLAKSQNPFSERYVRVNSGDNVWVDAAGTYNLYAHCEEENLFWFEFIVDHDVNPLGGVDENCGAEIQYNLYDENCDRVGSGMPNVPEDNGLVNVIGTWIEIPSESGTYYFGYNYNGTGSSCVSVDQNIHACWPNNNGGDWALNVEIDQDPEFDFESISNSGGYYRICSNGDFEILTSFTDCVSEYSVEVNGDWWMEPQLYYDNGGSMPELITIPQSAFQNQGGYGGAWRITISWLNGEGTSSFEIPVTKEDPTSVTVGSEDYYSCEGTPTTMAASGPGTLTWNNGSTDVYVGTSYYVSSPTQTTNYSIESDVYCTTPGSVTLHYAYNPVVSLSGNPSTLCSSAVPYTIQSAVTINGNTVSNGNYNFSHPCIIDNTYVFDPSSCNSPYSDQGNKATVLTYTDPTTQCFGTSSAWNFYYDALDVSASGTDPLCDGNANGSATASVISGTGVSPFTYAWTGGGTASVKNNLSAGTYSVTVTDNNSCSSTTSVTLSNPPPVSVSTSNITNAPCPNTSLTNQYGSAQVSFSGGAGGPWQINTGTGFYSVGSSPSTPSLVAGTYTVVVKDGNGCTGAAAPLTINSTSSFGFASGFPDANDATCAGVNNGSIDITISGGTPNYTYQWAPGSGNVIQSGTNYTISSLATSSSNYYVTVTDAATNYCRVTAGPFTIGESNPAQWSVGFLAGTPPTCDGLMNGSVTAAYTGTNTGPYSYAWSTGASSATLSNAATGTYYVTLTDVNECTKSATTSLIGQNPDQWQQSSDNANNDPDQAVAVVTDANENVYVLGTFLGETQFSGNAAIDCGQSTTAFYVSKYDNCGDLLWVMYPDLTPWNSLAPPNFSPIDLVINGTDLEIALHHDKTGGFASNQVVFVTDPPTAGISPSVNSGEYTLILTASLSDGEVTSVEKFDDFDFLNGDVLTDMELQGSTLYMCGRVDDKAEVWSFSGSTAAQAAASSTAGNGFSDIEFDGSGNLFAVGTVDGNSTITFGLNYFTTGVFEEGVIAKFNSSFVNQHVVRTFSGKCTTIALEIDGSGNPYAAGNTDVAFDNMYIVKMNSSLNSTSWTSTFSSMSNASWAKVADLIIDADGRIAACGTFQGTSLSMTANSSALTIGGSASNASDIWICALDPSNALGMWSAGMYKDNANPSGNLTAMSMAASVTNNYIVGNYADRINFYQSNEPDLSHPNNQQDAMFAVRFGTVYSSGNLGQFYKWEDENEKLADTDSLEFAIYPNPFESLVYLTWPPLETGNAEIAIFDLSGRMVYSEKVTASVGTATVDLPTHPPGTYFVRVKAGERTWNEKMIKY